MPSSRLLVFNILTLVLAQLALASTGWAQDAWPGWRGPQGDGSVLADSIPLTWDGETGENIVWKIPVPGTGHGSPTVWADRIWIVACDEDKEQRLLVCYDRKSGEELWRRMVLEAPLEDKHQLNSYASCTPATDGQHVYVAFLDANGPTIEAPNVGSSRQIRAGQVVMACFTVEGEQVWKVTVGPFISAHGFCSNPVIYKDLVILNGDHDGESYLVALDRKTGEVAWKTPREHKTRSYATPLLRRFNNRDQLILSGSQCVAGFDPQSGKRLWIIEGPTEQFVSSMVATDSSVFLTGGYPTYHVMSVDPTGSGDVTDSHVRWHVTNAKCYVPSPVICGDYLMVADDRGTANCFSAETGERLWQERLGRGFHTSLVATPEMTLFIAEDGEGLWVRPGETFTVAARNRLGEWCHSSPAFAHGCWFFRGEEHLICVGPSQPSR